MKNIHLRVIIPQKLIRKVSKLVFEKTKRMYLRKYPDHIFSIFLILMYLLNIQSIRRLYQYILEGKIGFKGKLPSRKTVYYRLKFISKKKLSKKLKKLFGTLLVIDSTPLKWKNLRLHMLYEARAKILLSFNVSGFNEAKEAEFLLEDIEGSIVLGDRGYWVMELMEKMKEKRFNVYVRPRGKMGRRFLEGELSRYIYLKRWEIEWFVERLKMKVKLMGVNRKTLASQITYMLFGMQLTILVDTLVRFPKLLRLLVNYFYIRQGVYQYIQLFPIVELEN